MSRDIFVNRSQFSKERYNSVLFFRENTFMPSITKKPVALIQQLTNIVVFTDPTNCKPIISGKSRVTLGWLIDMHLCIKCVGISGSDIRTDSTVETTRCKRLLFASPSLQQNVLVHETEITHPVAINDVLSSPFRHIGTLSEVFQLQSTQLSLLLEACWKCAACPKLTFLVECTVRN